MPTGAGLDLLGVEVQWAGEGQQPLAQVPGAAHLADLHQSRHQPERADREAALFAGEAVVGLLGAVAQHQAILGELVGDRQHGGPHPRVVRRQESEQRHQQQGGVQGVAAVALGKHAPGVHAVGQDVGLDLVGHHSPLLGEALGTLKFGQFGTPVQRHPAHYF